MSVVTSAAAQKRTFRHFAFVPLADILPFMLVDSSGKTKSARLRTIGVVRCARQEPHEDPLIGVTTSCFEEKPDFLDEARRRRVFRQ
jgi:hypothetical protein